MNKGGLVYIHDHAASGEGGRGEFGIIEDYRRASAAGHADERDETLLVDVLLPKTGEMVQYYDWQLRIINESR